MRDPANLNRREQEQSINRAWDKRCEAMRCHGQINPPRLEPPAGDGEPR